MTKARLEKLLEMARLQGSLTATLELHDELVGPSLKEQIRWRCDDIKAVLWQAANEETAPE